MAAPCKRNNAIHGHPCFGGNHQKHGRMHLPVAPRCNISCGYCERRHDCANESRPGITSRLLTPDEAIERVRLVMSSPSVGSSITVVGIAGPGDPLANEETFTTFELVKKEFPSLSLCMSTNGLLLPDAIDRLNQIGLHSLTVTVNALDPEVGARIYRWVDYRGRRLRGKVGAACLIRNQLKGIRRAAESGMMIKINTVLIPGINDDQIPAIARTVKSLGAMIMNIMPVIPQGAFAHVPPPSEEYLRIVREVNQQVIGQFSHCRQCRADAVGLIGQDIPLTSGNPSCPV